MSSIPPIESFKGTGTWEECDDFIQAIREAAWKEGKVRDEAWMADLASLRFSRRASLWYTQLPKEVRHDWSQLQASILTRWAPPEDDVDAKIEPTPAAAPWSTWSGKSDLSPKGILKVTIDESNSEHYVCKAEPYGYCTLTGNVSNALRVRCSPSSNGTFLERVDNPSHCWFALQWNSKTPNIGAGSTDLALFSLVDSDTLKSSWSNNALCQIIKCILR